MASKSVEALATLAVVERIAVERPVPPKEFSAAEAHHLQTIVDHMRVDWFSVEMQPPVA